MKNEVKMEEMKEEEEQAADVEMADASKMHGYERLLDVNYTGEQWAEARVLDLDADAQRLFVHYMGWNARYDAWVGLDVIAAHGTHTSEELHVEIGWFAFVLLTYEPEQRPHPRRKQAGRASSRCSRLETDPRRRTASASDLRLARARQSRRRRAERGRRARTKAVHRLILLRERTRERLESRRNRRLRRLQTRVMQVLTHRQSRLASLGRAPPR